MSTKKEPFDLQKFCKRHLLVKNWRNNPDQVYTTEELKSLLVLVLAEFQKEPMLVEIAPPLTIVGDIHGQYDDLIRLLNFDNKVEDNPAPTLAYRQRWVFLGDYVDRGFNSLECICTLFALKIAIPKKYVLLRGNHETRVINFRYGFRHELVRRLPTKKEAYEMWECFNEVFASMPLACLVGQKILCMHGGIGPELTSLDAIREIPRPLFHTHEVRLAQDLLWADPDEQGINNASTAGAVFAPNPNRGVSVRFNTGAVEETCRLLKIDMIVRGHQLCLDGYKFFCDKKLVTIFSAPGYMNMFNNAGAVLKVAANGKVHFVVIRKTKIIAQAKTTEELTRYPGKADVPPTADVEALVKSINK